ncbi:nitroreductase family protein [Thomasclavelia cocleata]|jgi:nitroreductase|uniref:nitroreductase family protein n=1 Tax=Thomasclavelia cocleata TaxID=69824 RepID=UPI00242FBD28|nr:nitroreductase family protein [Thomasclavelia cocleata]MCI9132237.1 nitroreductase [Thomasclavelia cocleata]MCI9630143.1 nitroreductase [Thomasclavelia cocleata]
MELDTIINTRRSIRKYKNQPIEVEKVEMIIKAAVEAESWKNSQTARYHIITSKELLIEFKKTCLPEFNQENCKDAPVLIVSTFIKNRSGFERDGTASNELGNGWGCYDLGIHNQNLILKATELGIGSLIMGIRDEKKIRTLLNIPASEIIVSVIALGISDIEPERPKRKNIDEICKFY